MAKSTPAQTFAKIFAQFTHPSTPPKMRANAERQMDAWLAKNGKTRADIQAILLQAAIDDGAVKAPPTTSADPRDAAPNPFTDPTLNPAGVIEGLVMKYATMGEHARVIYVLWVISTHVYKRFAIVSRLALISKVENSGKTILLEIARRLVLRPNRASFSTGAAVADFINEGPGTVCSDEIDLYDPEARRYLRLIWNVGHYCEAARELMVKGERTLVSLYAPMIAAGVGDVLARTQESRTYVIEMRRYTRETRPERNFYADLRSKNPDAVEAIRGLDAAYTYVRKWAANVELNSEPAMPEDIITRYADNARGLIAVADACGPEWGERARAAVAYFMAKDKAERPEIAIIRHGLVIFDALGVAAIRATRFNRELKRLDLPDAKWTRYRGASNMDKPHSLTLDEQATLLGTVDIGSARHRYEGERFRGYTYDQFETAAREHGVTPPDDAEVKRSRLRLIGAPTSD